MGSGTELCDKTTNTISGLLASLGGGIPDSGDIFGSSSSLFKQISDKMGLAIPGTNWIGDAADAYLKQNIGQQLRTKALGDIDRLTGNLVSNQAKYISDTRKVLSAMHKTVSAVRKACKKAEKIPIVGKAVSLALAVPACGTAMSVVGGALLYLTLMTMHNTTNLKGLLGRLLEMTMTLPTFPGLPSLPIPGLPEISWPPKLPEIPIPGLPNIPGLPEFTWPPAPGRPDFNLPIPGLPEFQWPSIPGLPEFNWPTFPSPIPGFPNLPGLPTIPDFFPGLPGLANLLPGVGNLGKLPTWIDLAVLPDFLGDFTGLPSLNFSELLGFAQLPAVGELTATMQQLSQLPSANGLQGNITGMISGQTNQIVSMAQQGGQQRGPMVDDIRNYDETGGAAGTGGVERAPVDTEGDKGRAERRVLD
ncbi:EspA/EspE family type VII secretion system effector [Mycobacterium angelicum]|uniref:Secretion protein EspE n=1 Tax=Mycobacterium angelicum TaxID=470074 RepID=A0A1W9ZMS0_MYCAN|nr:EspA/EspE family type VII secretion system effector [Mycobacterium angelicum]MCV7200078.1 secretion protein EspE [Mycobacterium angelicum]ORA19111.1 secretion protein EspE [Mycobacterium angelicum]